jgi:hypothetical protein
MLRVSEELAAYNSDYLSARVLDDYFAEYDANPAMIQRN